MKILLCLSDGIGNVLETLPVVSTLEKAKGWEFSFCLCGASYFVGQEVLNRPVRSLDAIRAEYIQETFDGVIATGKAWDAVTKAKGRGARRLEPMLLNDPAPQTLKDVQEWTRSEVDWRLDIARELGASEGEITYDYDLGTAVAPKYNVVIADGYNRHNPSQRWNVKSYPRWGEVACLLREAHEGLSICSIGAEDEYVCGTMDETGRPLPESLGIIDRADLVLANDTGMYHAAALLGMPCIAVFTFTDLKKNYDPRFHRTCHILARDLPCRIDCYSTGRVKHCPNNHECRNISPQTITNRALETL